MPALVVACALGAGVAAPAAPALEVGFGDNLPSSYADPRLRALGLRLARVIVPWDAATTEPAAVQAQLDALAAAGMAPHVAFAHRRADRCPSQPCVIPTRAQFRAAFAAFRARFPQVSTFTVWNEANHRVQPVSDAPEAVAGFYEEMTSVCPGCRIVAGDVLDSGDFVGWLERFREATSLRPQLWGVHNYGDVTYGRTRGTDAVLAATEGQLWVDETGGIVTLRDSRGRETLRTDETRAAASVRRAFAIAADRPRITRMYVYHWHSQRGIPFDSALTRPDGSLRPSYFALRDALAALRSASAPATARMLALRWRVSWSKTRRGRLVLRVTCRTADRRCRGRVSAVARLQAKAGGRTTTRRLATRRAFATTPRTPTATLVVRVGPRQRSRLRRAKVRRLRLTVRPTLPAGPVTTMTLRLARPR